MFGCRAKALPAEGSSPFAIVHRLAAGDVRSFAHRGGGIMDSSRDTAGTGTSGDIASSAVAKMSRRLLPLIGISYLIAYMDRANVSFASLQMNIDLGFSAVVYGIGAGLFFVGYSLFEIPSNLLLVRFGARRWIARIMLTWGLISAGITLVHSPLQFYAMRFLLGVAEAGFFPGVMFYLSSWFPAGWRCRAVSGFYIALPLSTVVMGGLAGILLGLDGRFGLAGWQWLLLVEAVPAVVMAVVLLLFLPDSPDDVAWLSADEKSWIARALAADTVTSGAVDHGLWRAMLDPLVLTTGLVVALGFCASNAIVFSAPRLLMQATGGTAAQAGYIVAAGGGMTVAAMLLIGRSSDRRHERHLHFAAILGVSAIGVVMMATATGAAGVVVGYLLFIITSANVGVMGFVIVGDGIHPGSRAVSYAALNMIAQIGNFVGPVLWGISADRTGSFTQGLVMAATLTIAAMMVVLAMRGRVRVAVA
jgi:MFS transporter, ACS family, tartrate transporter